jgi:RimJ/RimL family protein N-acetyltransferase
MREDPFAGVEWPLRTARLTLRPASRADGEATWQFRRLPLVNRWLTRGTTTLTEYEAAFQDPSSLAKTLIIERDGDVIGDLMVDVQDAWGQAEVVDCVRRVQADLGWVLHPDHAGCGYATEAVRAVLDLCFEQLGLRRVTATCFADNQSSWRLMDRVGMRRETYSLAESLHRSGQWMDTVTYALLRTEWMAASHPSSYQEDQQ